MKILKWFAVRKLLKKQTKKKKKKRKGKKKNKTLQKHTNMYLKRRLVQSEV
jgi:hypothetical protein